MLVANSSIFRQPRRSLNSTLQSLLNSLHHDKGQKWYLALKMIQCFGSVYLQYSCSLKKRRGSTFIFYLSSYKKTRILLFHSDTCCSNGFAEQFPVKFSIFPELFGSSLACVYTAGGNWGAALMVLIWSVVQTH